MQLRLPRYVRPKSLRDGSQSFYFEIPSHFRKLGCTVPSEPLGDYITACGVDGQGGRAATLNGLFDEWQAARKGKMVEGSGAPRVGSVDWLFREFKRSRAYLDKVGVRSRGGYEWSMQAICDTQSKKHGRLGSMPIKVVTPRVADMLYEKFITSDDKGTVLRRGEKWVGLCRKAWRVVHRLYPAEFPKDIPNPWPGVTQRNRVKQVKNAVTRDDVYKFANGCIAEGGESAIAAAAAAVICFEWLQRPENVIAGHIKWSGYRQPGKPPTILIEHHKTGAKIDHPLEATLDDGSIVHLYPEAEAVLSHLKRLGTPMILREIKTGKGEDERTTGKTFAFSGMQKIVQRMRVACQLPDEFTLDACRHGGMTELEEAELTDGQGRALSAHRTRESYAGYAKRTAPRVLAATMKRHAHIVATKAAQDAKPSEAPPATADCTDILVGEYASLRTS
ncbi:MAG: hypothetical protein JWQ94_4273 [Tardiphaga sp.]|nr:hypothetical protein [Tardiphaga sp.]